MRPSPAGREDPSTGLLSGRGAGGGGSVTVCAWGGGGGGVCVCRGGGGINGPLSVAGRAPLLRITLQPSAPVRHPRHGPLYCRPSYPV